ncbi:hypothetical protein H1Q59_08545 [Holosporaceae bacterium 'Namur']|nr:hypothetical protein [Holosporaceae bacterium 'Namur']
MLGSSSSQGRISSSTDLREGNTSSINLLFRLTKEQYESNMINIKKFIKLAQNLDMASSRLEQKNIIIDLYETLNSIPYKYGRQHIDKFDQKILYEEGWNDSKYLTSLGLPSLIEDLQNCTEEQLDEILSEELIKEISHHFVTIGKNMKYYQLKENVVKKDISLYRGIDIEQKKLTDAIEIASFIINYSETEKENISRNIKLAKTKIENKIKELKWVLFYQQMRGNNLSLEDLFNQCDIRNLSVLIPDRIRSFSDYRTLYKILYSNSNINVFQLTKHNEIKQGILLSRILDNINSADPSTIEEIVGGLKNSDKPYDLINKICLSEDLYKQLHLAIKKQGMLSQKDLESLINVINNKEVKQELLEILKSSIRDGKGKQKEDEKPTSDMRYNVSTLERIKEILLEQKETRRYLEDIISFSLFISKEIGSLSKEELNNRILAIIKELIELQENLDKQVLSKELAVKKVNLVELKREYQVIENDIGKLEKEINFEELKAKQISQQLEEMELDESEVAESKVAQLRKEINKLESGTLNKKILAAKKALESYLQELKTVQCTLEDSLIAEEERIKTLETIAQINNKLSATISKLKLEKRHLQASNKAYQCLRKMKDRIKTNDLGSKPKEFYFKVIGEELDNIKQNYINAYNEIIKKEENLNAAIKSKQEELNRYSQERSRLEEGGEQKAKKFNSLTNQLRQTKDSLTILQIQLTDKRIELEGSKENIANTMYKIDASHEYLEREYGSDRNKVFESLLKSYIEFSEDITPQEMHKVKLVELRRYQEEYDKRNIKSKLEFYKKILEIANSNITIIAAVADFVNWQRECCGEEMGSRLMNVLQIIKPNGEVETNYLKDLRDFRHKGIHCLDDIKRAQDATSLGIKKNIKEVRRYLLGVIEHLLDHNLSYLETGEEGKLRVPKHFIRAAANNEVNSCLPALPFGGQPGQLSYEQQVRMFTASIGNGQKLVRLIKEELESDNEGYGLDRIIEIASRSYKALSDNEMRIKLKYTTLLLALGEVIGNLQRHELLTGIAQLDIRPDENVEIVTTMIPDIREYRNALTHHGYHNSELFKEAIKLIWTDNEQIITEINYLYEKVKEESKKSEILKRYDFDAIRQEEIPLEKSKANTHCILN